VRGLLRHRYEVIEARGVEEALGVVEIQRPDLVLTDVIMPGKGGLELCREIKADARLRSTPVVMLTARVGSEAMLEAYEAGADDYIAKPFHAQEFLARIAAQLRLRAQAERLAEIERGMAALAGEVRGPLDTLAAAVARLEARAPDGEAHELHQTILAAARRVDEIVTRLGA
jgi:DNA-binding response OmpR family regulator